MRNNDPFNPEYRKEKNFWRKNNKKRIIAYIFVMIALVYGSREFLDTNIIEIELRTVTDRKINSISFVNGRCELFIINRSPYKIRLKLDDNIISNYNNGPLEPDVKYYFWFESNGTETLNLGGVKS
jgi:hypothetical protein